ncbi:hypothetical protein KD33_10930 [Clostridium sp. NCR]|nr:hypothetical protein KD33_10930 [Clostridium sp. NCR]
MAKKLNKKAQNEFLELNIDKQIEILNDAVIKSGTEGISSNLEFSYSWVQKVMESKKVYYVASIKKFVKVEDSSGLSELEVSSIKAIIADYDKLQKYKNNNDKDIRYCAGTCGNETITRSIVIDKYVNERFNEFSKKKSFITSKDLFTSAMKEFLDKYDN